MKQDNYFFHFRKYKESGNICMVHNIESSKLKKFKDYGLSTDNVSSYSYEKQEKGYLQLAGIIRNLDSCVILMNLLGFEIKQIVLQDTEDGRELLVLLNSKF